MFLHNFHTNYHCFIIHNQIVVLQETWRRDTFVIQYMYSRISNAY